MEKDYSIDFVIIIKLLRLVVSYDPVAAKRALVYPVGLVNAVNNLAVFLSGSLVVLVTTVDLEGNNDRTVDLFVKVGKVNGVDIIGIYAVTGLDHVNSEVHGVECGKSHSNGLATVSTLNLYSTVGLSGGKYGYVVRAIIVYRVAVCSKNYIDNDAVVCIEGVCSCTVNGTRSYAVYNIGVISGVKSGKSDGVDTVDLVLSTAILAKAECLASGGSGRSGSNYPVTPSVALSGTKLLRGEAGVMLAVYALCDLDGNPLAIASVGMVGGRLIAAPNVTNCSTNSVNVCATAVSETGCSVGTLPLTVAKTGVVDVEGPNVAEVLLVESRCIVAKSNGLINDVEEIATVVTDNLSVTVFYTSRIYNYIALVLVTAKDLSPAALGASTKGVVCAVDVLNNDLGEGVLGANVCILALLANNVAKVLGSTISEGDNELTSSVLLYRSDAKAVLTILTVSTVSTVGTVDAVLTVNTVDAILTVSTSACNENSTDHEAHH